MRIGLASPRVAQNLDDGLQKIERLVRAAAEQGAEIVCFPEAYLPGLRGLDFEVFSWGAADHERALAAARDFARASAIAIIHCIERPTAVGRLIAAYVIDAQGQLLGCQTKNQLDPSEDQFYVPGHSRQLFEVNGVKFGIAICHEGWRYPETVRWAAVRGAKIVFHPQHTGYEVTGPTLTEFAAKGNPYYEQAMLMRSRENTIYFASVNYALKYPESATALIKPTGECQSHLPYGMEGVLVEEIDVELATGLLGAPICTGQIMNPPWPLWLFAGNPKIELAGDGPRTITTSGTRMSEKPKSLGEILQEFARHRQVMQQELQRVIVGQHDVIEQLFAAIFTRGHCLLEGVPGLAKTLMVSTLARILDVGFKRIQFTPDLMPSDITGTNVLEEDDTGRRSFRFVEGPVFTNILLADEINRTPPKTQAALLQAMQEREITVGRTTYDLPDPFFVIATQNPIDQEGTYPLPEAQLDRFMFNIKVGYPTSDEEERILASTTRQEKVEVKKILNAKQIVNVQKLVGAVAVSEHIVKYTARLIRATRPKDDTAPKFIKDLVDWGAGPRAGQFLINGGKAIAAMEGRFSVAIEDIRKIAVPVLRHRVSTNFQAQAEGMTNEDLINRLIKEVPAPEIQKFV